ncbi:hypothetical protein BgiBS90_002449 [Biomphalaria glabrata]|nr:hypothetical protein BgiBS90_002449 [Biomphalaria glabrata]
MKTNVHSWPVLVAVLTSLFHDQSAGYNRLRLRRSEVESQSVRASKFSPLLQWLTGCPRQASRLKNPTCSGLTWCILHFHDRSPDRNGWTLAAASGRSLFARRMPAVATLRE